MFKLRFLLMAALMVCIASSASASIITWTTTDLFAGGDNDAFISTNGTGVLAFNGTNSSTGSVTANTVVFNNINTAVATGGFTSGGVTFTSATPSTENLNSFANGDFTNGGNVDALIEGAIFNVPDFTLSGLTPGDQYEIQLLVNDSRTNGGRDTGSWQVGLNDGNGGTTVAVLGSLQGPPTRNNGDFFTGTFTADASGSHTVVLTATRSGNISVGDDIAVVPNGGQRQINAFQLRNITVAVPEPSSLALLGLGVFGLVARRKRA